MISLIIRDGLGNQLFQYAYTRYLQYLYEREGLKEEIVINPYYIDRFDFRKVTLQNFRLNRNVRFLLPNEQKSNMNAFRIRIIFANGVDLIPWKVFKTSKPLGEEKYLKRSKLGLYYTYTSQTEYKTVLANTKNKYVFGCFQGEANFEPIKYLLQDELEVITEPSQANRNLLSMIRSTNSVCLHIRRGDYLDPKWKNLQVCTFDYYDRAISRIIECVNNPTFFVFSNTHEDIEWIKQNYKFGNNQNKNELQIVYVDLNNPDYEEFRLMKSCKHFIISNSTFSWWAAYLSAEKKKMVLAPDRWNLKYSNDDSIYLKDWIKVPTK